MKWKAQSHSEAGEILKLLARHGEPLLKKLDDGADFNLLGKNARNDEVAEEPPEKPSNQSAVAS